MSIVVANRLEEGDVVYLTDDGRWSASLAKAAVALSLEHANALLARASDDAAANYIVGPELIDVEHDPSGALVPVRLREKIRAGGPTVATRSVTPAPVADAHATEEAPQCFPGYRYDEFDHRLVRERVEEFRDQVHRRLRGELTEEEFRPLRLMNGLYLQLHAYMLRVAIPYGTFSSRQMRQLARIARTYDRGYVHVTTRQNVQFNWLRLVDVPDVLADLAAVEMHGIQTSGNCIRNITCDPFAGATVDEVADPRPWCELLRQWSSFHPELTYLPRKFKIAVTASPHDRAAILFHDIGLRLLRREDGELGFEVYVGGGLGRTPRIADRLRTFLPAGQLLDYVHAIVRTYNERGRRDNKFKARIKILVQSMGLDAFRNAVEATFRAGDPAALSYQVAEIARLRRLFASRVRPPPASEARSMPLDGRHWLDNNVRPHQVAGYASAVISLKPHGGTPGDMTAEQMDAVADLADRYALGEIRSTHTQNLVLPHVARARLPELWTELRHHGLANSNAGRLTDMITCPGLDYCSLASARSIPIARAIGRRFDDIERLAQIGPISIKISGCVNACAHHHLGDIGILGVERRGAEAYQLVLGGSATERASLAACTGRGFTEDTIIDAVEAVVQLYLSLREPNENFAALFQRVGMQPFKEVLYGSDEPHGSAIASMGAR